LKSESLYLSFFSKSLKKSDQFLPKISPNKPDLLPLFYTPPNFRPYFQPLYSELFQQHFFSPNANKSQINNAIPESGKTCCLFILPTLLKNLILFSKKLTTHSNTLSTHKTKCLGSNKCKKIRNSYKFATKEPLSANTAYQKSTLSLNSKNPHSFKLLNQINRSKITALFALT
jgi:hypothetical protein